jgi:DNA-binding IclR family transcriptional regulator
VESVDNALRILQALRDSGQLRVSEIAGELGIARSTAHRLLSMLVYRDFAIRSDDHSYLPGPALSAPPLHGEPMARLRSQLRPHMEALRDQLGETINLQVRLGAQTRFLYTAESAEVLRVGDRQGTILPAWITSGGKVLLAALPDAQLTAVLGKAAADRPPQSPPTGTALRWSLTDAARRALITELRQVREQGWAENIEESESGLCAVGVCVRDSAGTAVAALSVAAPAARYSPDKARAFVRALRATVAAAQPESLALSQPGGGTSIRFGKVSSTLRVSSRPKEA